jgi:hypothetical protein
MNARSMLGIALLLVASVPAAAAGPFQYTPITPCRVFDTRTVGPQTNGNPLTGGGAPIFFRLQGYCGLPIGTVQDPNAGVAAVSLNLTIVTPSQGGDMRLYPANVTPGLNDPSTINYDGGEVALANGAILPLAPLTSTSQKDMQIVLTPGTVHAIIDVTGYFR